MSLATSPSLSTLPAEVIHEIFNFLGLEEPIPLYGRSVYAMSRTNRKFRDLALDYMCYSIELSWPDLHRLLLRNCGGRLDPVVLTRARFLHLTPPTVECGRKDTVPLTLDMLRRTTGLCCFQNLLGLNIAGIETDSDSLEALGNPHLQTLIVRWSVGEEELPDVSNWPLLSTLAVVLEGGHHFISYVEPVVSYRHLTGLYIDEECLGYNIPDYPDEIGWFTQMARRVTFPCLRSFAVLMTVGPFDDIYKFIQRHPTLLEVNVSSINPNLDLSTRGIIKLIEGIVVEWDSDSLELVESFPHGYEPHHDHIPICEFGFTRVADVAASRDAGETRYLATSLALKQINPNGDPMLSFANIRPFLLMGKERVFSKVETLRLWLKQSNEHTEIPSFSTLMGMIASWLKSWPNLRSFHLSMYINKKTTWHGQDVSSSMPFLDEVVPINDCWASSIMGKDLQVPCDLYLALSHLASLGKLEYPQTEEARLEVVNNILDEICRMFNIAPSDKHLMATRDIFILLHFWRRRHNSKMEALAWQFGSACPLLKEFAWYPSGDWSRGQLKTRWLWIFGFPDEKGERSAIDRRLFSILPGDKVRIIKIPILVGEMQKLSEERMYHQRRFNPYREYWP